MAFKAIIAFILLSLHLFPMRLCSSTPHSIPVDAAVACNSTVHPKFCRSVGRFSLSKSLDDAQNFLAKVNRYLSQHSALSRAAVSALEDCRLLSSLNVEFLTSALAKLNFSDSLIDIPRADEVQTLLSALLTNQQTCSDGLWAAASAWTVKNGLVVPITNTTKIYSVSLAIFSKAWVGGRVFKPHRGGDAPTRRSLFFHRLKVDRNGSFTLRMPGKARALFEKWTGRSLLQATDTVMVSDVVVVNKRGKGNFTTVGEAVASAPSNLIGSTGYYLIYVTKGVYDESVLIPRNKKYLMMIGDGMNRTVITGNRSVADGWTTFNSATFAVIGQGFVAINMTIRNTAGAIKVQAVAVRNGADLSTFYRCSLEGYQDTLYAHSMRQFYGRCNIYGTVDFIFGNAAAVFQRCKIYARLPIGGQANTITAQGRSVPNQNTGTSMHRCKFLAVADLTSSPRPVKTYLGRPWQLYSRTVVMKSFMDSLIDPSGWAPWNASFALDTLYFAEYGNAGPGANTTQRVAWPGYHMIDRMTASNFTAGSFIMGDYWLPFTEVPYDSGL